MLFDFFTFFTVKEIKIIFLQKHARVVRYSLITYKNCVIESPTGRTYLMQKTGLYWLGNDLRRHDNLCLEQASKTVEHLLIVFCIEPQWLGMGRYQQIRMTQHRRKFFSI